ncbi:MAG: sigma-54-dependent transcriptional regulator [Pseudobdellovibrionaceae bacterium]
MKPTILAIDNDQLVLKSLTMLFQDQDIEIATATSGVQGIALLRQNPRLYSLVLLDFDMKTNGVGMNGDEVARQLKAVRNDIRIIMVSGHNTPETIEACLQAGAEQFVVKGSDTDQLINIVRSALFCETCEETETESERHQKISRILKMVGRSREMAKVAELVSRFSEFSDPVLILGESGAGKEGIAKAVHENSTRRAKPFIAINCAAVPKDMLESELFGHERGAFTGAITKKLGLLEKASGGTVFLDEIGDMPLELQAKILRALQEKKIQPVGGSERAVDFRVVAATHKNLKQAAESGAFRHDLYFRLNYLSIEVPPLRERPEDIEPLVRHFLRQQSQTYGVTKAISDSAMRKLKAHSWPGNVRALEAVVKKAFAMSDSRITEDTLGDEFSYSAVKQLESLKAKAEIMPYKEFERLVQDAERSLLIKALDLANGVKSVAAGLLGMSHSTMNHHRAALGLDESGKRDAR